jgi:hypothetical protein
MADARPQVSQDDPRSVTVAALFAQGGSRPFLGNATILSRNLAVTPSTIVLSRIIGSRAVAIRTGLSSETAEKTYPPVSLAFLRYQPTPKFYFLPAEVVVVDQELGFAVLSFSGDLPLPHSPDLLGDGEVPPPRTECEVLYYDETSQVLTQISGQVSNRRESRFRLRLDPNAPVPVIGAPVLKGNQVVGMVASAPPAAFESNSLSDPFPFVEVLGVRAMAESHATPEVRILMPWIEGSLNAFAGSQKAGASGADSDASEENVEANWIADPDGEIHAAHPSNAAKARRPDAVGEASALGVSVSEQLPENPRPIEPIAPLRARFGGTMPFTGYSTSPMAANPTPKVASDLWCESDQLGYEAYARTIASLITHRETVAPLTIGIKAPWGAGKTSLMKRVQHLLDGYAKLSEESRTAILQEWQPPQVTLRELLQELKGSSKPTKLESKRSKEGEGYGLPARITVWFNAWKYQTSEQIWAGMAHCIISQVTARMDVKERELFWLRLHGRRVNVDEVRKKVYEVVLRKLLPMGLLVLGVCVIAFWIAAVLPVGLPWRYAIRAVPVIWGGFSLAREWGAKLGEKAAGTVRELIREPDYEGKMGYLHLVESDIREVLLLATEASMTKEKPNGDPLVVFVDDLDRCAPNKVAEVVEAINLFLCGDYPNCIFVLGMEPGMVAAALEVANKEVIEKAVEMGVADATVPVGWRFMEKIVQLPITIPPPTKGGKDAYVKSLTGVHEANVSSVKMFPDVPEQPIPASSGNLAGAMGMTGVSINKVIRDVVRARELALEPLDEAEVLKYVGEMEGRTLGEVEEKSAKVLTEAPPEKRRAAAEASKRVYARAFSERDPAMMEFVNEVAELVDGNPRQIKRYVNVFRFYSTLRHSLRVDGTVTDAEIPSDKVLAKFVALSIQWPHAVDCLRVKRDVKGGETNGRRMTVLELLELQSRKTAEAGETPEMAWEKFVGKDGLGLGAWAARRGFREFLSRGESLCEKEGHGLW